VKTILYRMFGLGAIPRDRLVELEREVVVVLDEGIRGSLTWINFRAPWKYHGWRRVWISASLALTEVRLLALSYSRPIINIPLRDQRFAKLRISLEKDDVLLVGFDPSLFHADWSGTIEARFRTPESQRLADELRRRTH
jgi:hypothetical protein